jgi:hypothetical protein
VREDGCLNDECGQPPSHLGAVQQPGESRPWCAPLESELLSSIDKSSHFACHLLGVANHRRRWLTSRCCSSSVIGSAIPFGEPEMQPRSVSSRHKLSPTYRSHNVKYVAEPHSWGPQIRAG